MDRFWGTIRRRPQGKPRTTPATSLSSLERLSDDLLLDITELVAIPWEKFIRSLDLLALMCCNRRMYILGEPVLYRTFIEGSIICFPRFIRTIIWRPLLTEYVRNVKFRETEYFNSWESTLSRRPTTGPPRANTRTSTSRLIHSRVRRVLPRPIHRSNDERVLSHTDKGKIQFLIKSRIIPNNTDPDKVEQNTLTALPTILRNAFGILNQKQNGGRGNFVEGVEAGKWRCMAGFILSVLPNIEKLHVIIARNVDQPADGLAYVFLRAAEFRFRSTTSSSPEPLSRLRDLTISYDNRFMCLGIWSLFPYLAHHTLQSFTADGIGGFGDRIGGEYSGRDEYWSLLPPKLRLKSLRLERSNITAKHLRKLLQLCPVLEILKYEHYQTLRGEVIFEPKRFGLSIEHLKPCLRELELYRPFPELQITACVAEEVTPISLFGFEKLTRLSITANLLLGALKGPKGQTFYRLTHRWIPPPPGQKLAHCLPKSLEYLCLKECGEEIHEDVSELVEQAAIVTPNLKTLVLTNSGFYPYERSTRKPATERLFRMNQSAARRFEEDCVAKGIELSVLYK